MKEGTVEEKKIVADQAAEIEALKQAVAALLAKADAAEKSKPVSSEGFTPELMRELAASINKGAKTEEKDNYGYINESDIDESDWDPTGVLFTAPSTGVCIVDDVRRGQRVRTPYGNTIFFAFEGQIVSRDDRGRQVLNTFSTYLSRSKKEQKWLMEHTTYGIKFSTSAKLALSTDSMRLQKMQGFMAGIANLDNAALFARCKDAGLPVNNDVVSMRYALAEKQLDDHEKSTESATARIARETRENELFLADKSQVTRN